MSQMIRRRPRRGLVSAAALVAAAVIVSCDTPVTPPGEGMIIPRIAMLQPDSALRPMLDHLTSVEAIITGDAGFSRRVTLTLNSSTNRYTGRASGLPAGTYTVRLEGRNANGVVYYGRLPSITVARGETQEPAIIFAPTVPTMAAPALDNTTSFTQNVRFARVPNATGYAVELSQDAGFNSGVTSYTPTDTFQLVNVTATGVWHVRTRAALPDVPSASVPWSPSSSWTVVAATGGRSPAEASSVNTTVGSEQVVPNRNITSPTQVDWFEVNTRIGDSLIISTRTTDISGNPSALNTVLTLFRNDAAVQIATNDNGGVAGFDSRIVAVSPATEALKVRVSSSSSTVGHFELVVLIKRLAFAPTGLAATIVNAGRVDLGWVDADTVETGYAVDRCEVEGSTCTFTVLAANLPANSTSYSDNSVQSNKTYRWRVRAVNASGSSINSPTADAAIFGPNAPTGFTASTTSNTSITLAWTDAANNETGYEIERCTGAACDTFTALTSLPAGSTGHVDASAVYNTVYRYRIRAVNAVAASPYVGPQDASTVPPATPTGLAAVVAGATQINLTWTDVATDEQGYRIERCTGDACSNFAEIAQVGVNVNSYNDATVAFNTGYRYRVRAFHAVVSQDYSNLANADTRPPAAPTVLTATTTGPTSIDLAWNDNSDDETGFLIERCATVGCSNFAAVQTVAAGVESFTDAVVLNTVYNYRVTAVGVPGNSAPTNVASANTLVPAAPSGLLATTLSGTLIRLDWTDESNNETQWEISRCAGGACTPVVHKTIAAGVVTYTDTVTAGNTYSYTLRARNIAGASAASNTATANTIIPANPANLTTTTLSATRIDLAWTDIATTETAYEVERCTGLACLDFAKIADLPPNAASYSDLSVTYSERYRYRVRAVNAVGASDYAGPQAGNTVPPVPVSNFTATTAGATSISLSWTDNADDETGYRIERCEGDTCSGYAEIAVTAADATNYVDNGVQYDRAYRYRIRSFNVVTSQFYVGPVNADTRPPLTPTALVATTTSGTTIDLAWADNADDETAYRIERCDGAGCDSFVLQAQVPANTAAFTDNVTVGNTYVYRVIAVGVPGNSAASNTATANTILPLAPSGLAATTVSANQIDLSWADGSTNETGFEIQRCAGNGCVDFTTIGTVAANQQNYSDGSTVVGNVYTYRVRAVNVAGQSGFTNLAFANTLPPTAPTDLQGAVEAGPQVLLTWTNNAPDLTGTRVERCEGNSCSNYVEIAFVPAGNNQYADAAIVAGTQYRYRVRAQNAADVSAYSIEIDVTTALAAPPTVLNTSNPGLNQILLSWDTSVGPLLSGYVVERCTGVGCSEFTTLATIGDPGTLQYLDNVDPNSDYRYRVRATNPLGAGLPSPEAAGTTRAPAAPSGLVATVTTGAVELAWTDNSDNEATFEIQRACVGVGCVFGPLATVGEGVTTYRDDAVFANGAYQYRVYASNDAAPSAFSNEQAVTTALQPIATGLTAATTGPTSIQLNWTDNANAETGYQIERCSGDGCSTFSVVATVGANSVGYTDAGLDTEQSYTYQVRTVAAFGPSDPSNAATATTRLPAAPTDAAANTVANDQIQVTWTDNANNETGYTIERCEGNGCTNFASVGSVGANTFVFLDVGLAANTEFSYRVIATNNAGQSAPSNVASATTNLPATPLNVSVGIPVGAPDIVLTWTDEATDELDQSIERCVGVDCANFAEVASVAADVQQFIDAGGVLSQPHRYRIRARNGAGYSQYSAVVEIVYEQPAVPTGLSGLPIAGGQIHLTWSANNATAAEVRIERCAGIGCVDFVEIGSMSPGENFIDASPVPEALLRYRVRPMNGLGAVYSDPADVSNVTPLAPTGLAATAVSATQVDLTWVDQSNNETMFIVQRCTGGSCTDFATIGNAPTDTPAYSDATLTAGLVYRFRVIAANTEYLQSPPSNVVTAETNLPATPTDLTAVAQSTSEVLLTWTDNATNETDYLIERCTGVGCGGASFTTLQLLGANVNQYTDATVSTLESYSYRVRAVGSAGPSAFSAVATVVIVAPAQPLSLTATTTSGTNINLTWSDESNNELAMRVERCVGGGCLDFVEIAVLPPDTEAYSDASVTTNNTYTYRVQATNNVGASGFFMTATANTILPADPSGFAVTTVSAEQIDLTWTDNANNESGYVVERCAGVGCSDFTDLATLEPDKTGYQDTGLTPEESYSYRIRAFNVAGTSAVVGPLTATTILPLAPTALTATVVSGSQVDITWTDNATNEQGYRIERCSGSGCSSFIEVAVVGADVTNYSSTGLVQNSFYTHRVRAYNAAGTSAYSNTAQVNTFPPAAPSGLAATTQTATSVQLTWNDLSGNEAGFQVERCQGVGCGGVSFALIGTTGPNTPNFLDTTAPAGVSVSYRVRSFNGVANSSYTNTATASTVVPNAPSAMVAFPQGQTQIYTQWSDNATDEAGYRLERCEGAGCTNFVQITETGANVGSFVDTGVLANTVYRYRVIAFGNGVSDYSNIADVTTILPAAPSGLTGVAVSDNRIDLTWADNADNEDNFRVLRCSGALCENYGQVAVLPANTTAFSDLSVVPNETYRYVVSATNGAGESAFSAFFEVETNVPGLPSGLTATVVTATQIDLAWTDNATTETGFEIDRCTGESCVDFTPLISLPADAISYQDVTVLASTAYRYRIRALGATGNSGYSNIATAATNAPNAPTGFTATTVSGTQINLAWTDDANNEAGYEVERCTGAGCGVFTRLDSLPPNTTSFNDVTAVVDVEYEYRVRAVNAAGTSAYATASANTLLPAAPTTLTATTISATQIDLAWADVANNDTEYVIERCIGASCTGFVELTTLPANATAFSNTGLDPGFLYRYQVRARNVAGPSAPSNIAEASTDFPLPPVALTAGVNSPTQINLNWVDASGNEDGFEIERCSGAVDCDSFAPLASVGADVSNYMDGTVSVGNYYRYRVRAVNFAGASAWSDPVTINTFVPATITGITAVATSGTTVQLSWNTEPAALSYQVLRCEGLGCEPQPIGESTAPSTEYIDNTANTGVTYTYYVRGVNSSGLSDVDLNNVAVVALTPPAAPTGLATLALSSTQALLTWNDAATDETGYRVERCSGDGCSTFAEVATLPANSLNWQDDGLAPSGIYVYRVFAVNAVGSSAPSNEYPVSLNVPEAPSGLSATTTGPGQITLAWTDNTVRELNFSVERCAGLGCGSFVQVAVLPADATFFEDNGLSLNATYSYRVRALNNVGPSGFSNTATANTLLPLSPSGVTATTVTGPDVQLSWVDNANNESEYRILRCQGGGCSDYAEVGLVGANQTSFLDESVELGANYNYRIVALNISGPSAPSPAVGASTVIGQPSIQWIDALDRNSARIYMSVANSWENGTDVYRCNGETCTDFVKVAELPKGQFQFDDTGLTTGADYRYALRHRTEKGSSAPSTPMFQSQPADAQFVSVVNIADSPDARMRQVVTVVPSNVGQLRFRSPGPLNQYYMIVRRGAAPDLWNGFWDCISWDGSDCVFDGAQGGDWYVGFYPYAFEYTGTTVALGVQFQFSSCGTSGPTGPSDGACSTAYNQTANQGRVVTNNGIQSFTVPVAGTYEIITVGAQGASGQAGRIGGRGAYIAGTFSLTAGQVLNLAVGQMGSGQNSGTDGGGGGGTFVVDNSGNPLIVAGGGGGTRVAAGSDGCNASTTIFATLGSGDFSTWGCPLKNSNVGLGGLLSSPWDYGAGGAGFFGNGADDNTSGITYGQGGRSWVNGLFGGVPLSGCGNPAPGGFGGGGAGNGCYGGGGGGGYSGGDGGWVAGGGGSYNSGGNQVAIAGSGTGHGSILIRWVGP